MENSDKFVDKPALQFATPPRRLIYWLPIGLVAIGVIILTVALYNKYFSTTHIKPDGKAEIVPTVLPKSTLAAKRVVIDIGGAVVKPGLYELPDDSRIADVLIAAGGLDPNANRNYLSKSVNLAQKISDGQKIYIPFIGENLSPIEMSGNTSMSGNDIISVNLASSVQLDTLSGVGPVTASKIIAGRPYEKLDDLVSRKILSRSLFDKIKARLAL